MRVDEYQCLREVLDCLEGGKKIPFALERAASHYGININQVREVLEDMNAKTSEQAESWITGESWSYWPERYETEDPELWPEELESED